jgi:hypothetical protein
MDGVIDAFALTLHLFIVITFAPSPYIPFFLKLPDIKINDQTRTFHDFSRLHSLRGWEKEQNSFFAAATSAVFGNTKMHCMDGQTFFMIHGLCIARNTGATGLVNR